ncbi:lytic polysaccharide monooxygenase [Streptomyces sp. TR02-1]|uniref:lytic polysaccharide monooxygenase n=1 Tax=Streptomyces sp. TR02-1 TaxID=3385977 RepID=UPI0039A3D361
MVVAVFSRPSSEYGARHGYAEFPLSRARWCQKGGLDCGPISYEPQSVEGPRGFPAGGPRDGELASATNQRFSELDGVWAPNGKPWPVTDLMAGCLYQFRWYLTAPHSTAKFHYYLTLPGWNHTAKLTRASFDSEPWLTVEFQQGEISGREVSHWARIPSGRGGRHVLYAVWDVADTSNAFYSACDVNLTGP